MDGAAILGRFLAADRFATIQGHGHEVGGPIGKAQTDAGCLRLHHGTGPVAHRMKNVLAGDAQAGSVIVGAEVGGDAFSARRLNQGRKHEQGLRGFDHDLLDVRDAVIVQKVGKRGDLFDHGDLGKHDREIGRNPARRSQNRARVRRLRSADGSSRGLMRMPVKAWSAPPSSDADISSAQRSAAASSSASLLTP